MEMCPLCAPRGQLVWGKGNKSKLGQPQGQTTHSPTSLGTPLACPSPGKVIQHREPPAPPLHLSGSGTLQQEGVPRAEGRPGEGGGLRRVAGASGAGSPPGSAHGSAPRMLLTSAPLQLAQRLLTFIDCQ